MKDSKNETLPTKNQTFKIIPDLNTVQLVLDAFGLENLNDTRPFDKDHMKDFHIHRVFFSNKKFYENQYSQIKQMQSLLAHR